jgi:glycosyltransferase involved in cell wall biosynthesis
VSRLRIAFFGSSTAIDGGSELRLLELVSHFQQFYKVTLFLPDSGPLSSLASRVGVDVVDLGFLRLRHHRGLGWFHWLSSVLRARRQFARELLNRRIEMVHFNDFIDLPFYNVPRKLGIPAVSHLRLIVANSRVRNLYRAWIRRTGTFIIPVSEAVRSKMLGGDARIPSHILYDPRPDPMLFHPGRSGKEKPLRESFGWAEDDFVVVMLSKLLENKGHLPFLSVANQLACDTSRRFRFLMIAGPSPGREDYQRRVLSAAQQLPGGSFHWMPGAPHSEIPDLLCASDCLLHLPDTEDSFPGVVLEAMACGVPVAAYEAGGIPEQLDWGKAGVLVPRGDWCRAAEEVRGLACDRVKRETLIKSALQRLDREFSRERMFEKLEEVYREQMR